MRTVECHRTGCSAMRGMDGVNGTKLTIADGRSGNFGVVTAAGASALIGADTGSPDANNVITGSAQVETMYGLGGNDYLYGYGGNDLLVAGLGIDVLLGDAGNDTLYGEADQDYLFGGTGTNVLVGGAGADTYRDGAGTDYLFLDAGSDLVIHDMQSGVDVVNNFKVAQDIIRLEGTTLTSFAQVQAATSDYDSFIVITIDANTAIWLVGVKPADLTAANFTFA